MIQGVAINHTSGIAYIESAEALISFNAAADMSKKGSAPTTVFRDADSENGIIQTVVAAWGKDNLYPQKRMKLIEKDTELPALLDFKSRMLVGKGVIPFKIEGYTPNGHEILIPAPNEAEDAMRFLMKRSTKRFLLESAVDLNHFFNIFPEMVPSRDRSVITDIYSQEATDCRWEETDEKGRIRNCWINPDWANYKARHTKALPVIDKDHPEILDIIRSEKKWNYIYPVNYPTPGRKYYQLPHHDGFFESGWYDVGQLIPEAKKHLMKNQMSLKYHVEVDAAWWNHKYKGFDTMAADEQQKIMSAELAKFNEFLSGAKASGKTLMTFMEWDIDAKQYKGYWKVTVLNNPNKDGEYLEDSKESSMHKLRALGLDPTIVGLGPGRDNGSAGSGSDKWAAIKMYLAGLSPMRQVLLEPLEFIFDYNGWTEKGIVPRFVDHQFFYTDTASTKPVQNDNPNP
jgi:hypothetical protein